LHPDAIWAGFREGVRKRDFSGGANALRVVAVKFPCRRLLFLRRLMGLPGQSRTLSGHAVDKEFLGSHRECPYGMNVRENSPVLAPHHCVTEHLQIRLQQSGLVVGREQSETKRYVVVLYQGPGVFPDHFVAAAGANNAPPWIMRVIVPWWRNACHSLVHL